MSVNPFNFDRIVRPDVPHSFQNLSYDKKFTCNPGELIPCFEQEVFPGDVMKYKNAFICKTLPLTVPAMVDMYAYVHYWFVPYRLLQSHETIEKGLDTNTFEDYINSIHDSFTIPYLAHYDSASSTNVWDINAPVTSEVTSGPFAYCQVPAASNHRNAMFTLVDYMNLGSCYEVDSIDVPPSNVHAFMIRAYNAIWNTKYRDQNLQVDPSDVVDRYAVNDGLTVGLSLNNDNILRRNWIKDYFTSMLPWEQKGTPIALPVVSSLEMSTSSQSFSGSHGMIVGGKTVNSDGFVNLLGDVSASSPYNNFRPVTVTSAAFDINELRLSNSVQKFLEANALGGTTYHQFCISHFGTAPRDETLNLPLYLGGTKAPVLISEVTQSSSSSLSGSTPQGTLTGKGLASDASFVFKEKFREHGIVMGLFSIMPMPVYSGGVNRMWIKENVFSWYSPEFAHLGEQEIFSEELNVPGSTVSDHMRIIGYQGRWSEMRTRQNECCSGFISSSAAASGSYGGMSDWTIQRRFGTSSPAALNSSFIVCKPDLKFFAFPNSKNFIVDFGNINIMSRPLPALAEPLLVG